MQNVFNLSREPLSLEFIQKIVQNDSSGGQVFFVGTVRDGSNGKRVIRLEFEAYDKMVYAELEKIAGEIRLKWPVHSVVLHHRIGICIVGEIPVIGAVSAIHRNEAFEACSYLMNRLKQSVPIWKKEVYEAGEVWISSTP